MNRDATHSITKAGAIPTARSSHRWLRLSLRTSLVLVALVAVALGYIVQCENTRQAAEERIKPLGGSIAWRERGPAWLTQLIGRDVFAVPDEVAFLDEPLQDDDLVNMSGLEEATRLLISQNSTFTGRGLRHLIVMKNLEWLYIYDVPVSDDGLSNLPKIPTLRSIDLLATILTDKSIPFIEQFDYVDRIDVGSESLSRDAVEALDARMQPTAVGWSGQGYGGK